MGDVSVDDETIAVGDEVKKHYNQPRGTRRGGRGTAAAKALPRRQHGRGCPARARRRWAEGGGGGDDGGDNGATAAVAMWGMGDGGEGTALSMDDDDEANEPSPLAGWTPMGEGINDLMTAWHQLGGSW